MCKICRSGQYLVRLQGGIVDANREYSKFLIFRYVEDCFTEIAALLSDDLSGFTNLPSHGLDRDELEALLFELFENRELVALNDARGFFSPTRNEIRMAFTESRKDPRSRLSNTFYGLTSGATDAFRELESIYAPAT